MAIGTGFDLFDVQGRECRSVLGRSRLNLNCESTSEYLSAAFRPRVLRQDLKETGVVVKRSAELDDSNEAGAGIPIRPMLGNAEKLGAWFSSLTIYEIGLQMQVTF